MRPRYASKMLRRRCGVRRSGLGFQMVQGGRWGAVVRQGGGRLQPAAVRPAPPSLCLMASTSSRPSSFSLGTEQTSHMTPTLAPPYSRAARTTP